MNIKSLYPLILSVSFTIIFSGCNAEDSVTENPEVENTETIVQDSLSNNTQNTIDSKDAVFVDANFVEGLSYYCGDDVTLLKSTLADGSFSCTDLTVSFLLGNLYLGSIETLPLDNTIYTTDLLGIPRGATKNPEVTKLSVLVQSLDEDADLSNGINISEESLSLFNEHILIDTKIKELSLDDISYIIDDIISQRDQSVLIKIAVEDAQDNFTQMLSSAPPIIR